MVHGEELGQVSTKWTERHVVPTAVKQTLAIPNTIERIQYSVSRNQKSEAEAMVIGLLAIAAIPTVTGVGNAVSAQKRQNESMSKEQEKFHLTFMMQKKGKIEEVGQGVLVDKKVSNSSRGIHPSA
jgi:hypothetical protein